MSFFNKKITKIGFIVGVIFLGLVFYSQKGSAATSIEEIMSNSKARYQEALNSSVSFFISTGEAQPNSSLTVYGTSYSFDLNSSKTTWRVNGSVFSEGTGITKIEVPIGGAGSKTTISLDVTTVDGRSYHQETIVTPAIVDLVWQAETYTPAWYKGKPLPSSTSRVRITALPYFKIGEKLIPASDLVYSWKLNYENMPSYSGYGKNSFLINMPQLMYEARVEVEVSTKDKSIIRKGAVSLFAEETKTILYENHPTKGPLSSAALSKTIGMDGDTFNLKVEPFFFALRDFGYIAYNWSANGKKMEGTEKLNNLIFTRKAGEKGVSAISVETKNLRDFLQTATSEFLIDFNN